jgi:hypothetical protein
LNYAFDVADAFDAADTFDVADAFDAPPAFDVGVAFATLALDAVVFLEEAPLTLLEETVSSGAVLIAASGAELWAEAAVALGLTTLALEGESSKHPVGTKDDADGDPAAAKYMLILGNTLKHRLLLISVTRD